MRWKGKICQEPMYWFEDRCRHFIHEKCLEKEDLKCPCCETDLSGSKRVQALLNKENFSFLTLEKEDVIPLIKMTISDKSLPYEVIFEKCLKTGWGINDILNEDENICAVHLVTDSGRVDLLEYIISLGGDVNLISLFRGSPLIQATENCDIPMMKALIAKGADMNFKFSAPLHLAVYKENYEMVKYLIECGADVNLLDINENSALILAIRSEAGFDIIDLLLEHGAADSIDSCFLWSCKITDISYMHYFIEKGADIKAEWSYERTALHLASGDGHIETVKYLLEHGLDIEATSEEGLTPLFEAAENGFFEVVKFLVSQGASLNVTSRIMGWSMFQVACISTCFEIAEYLFDSGADFNAKTKYQQQMYFHLFKCPRLLKKVMDSLSSKDIPILHAICELGDYDLLLEYIEKGFDANTLNFNGEIALFYAKDSKLIEKLLEYPVDFSLKNNSGMTSFLMACEKENINLYERLLKFESVDIHAVCNKNRNALHYAVEIGNLDLIKILIQKGVNFNQIDFEGKRPVNFLTRSYVSCLLGKQKNENTNENYLKIISEFKEAGAIFGDDKTITDSYFDNNPVFKAYKAA